MSAAKITDFMNSLQFAPPNPRKWEAERFKFNTEETAKTMRLDQTLVARGLVPSRARAQDLIKRGFVRVDGKICDKPAAPVTEVQPVEIAPDAPGYVSRGAEKLTAALDRFGFDPAGAVALDIGASTGGFTEVLLGTRRASRLCRRCRQGAIASEREGRSARRLVGEL